MVCAQIGACLSWRKSLFTGYWFSPLASRKMKLETTYCTPHTKMTRMHVAWPLALVCQCLIFVSFEILIMHLLSPDIISKLPNEVWKKTIRPSFPKGTYKLKAWLILGGLQRKLLFIPNVQRKFRKVSRVAEKNADIFMLSFYFKIYNGGDLSLRDNDGFTPFHLAAREGHLQAFKDMLNNGTVPYFSVPEVLIKNRFCHG